PEYFGRTATMRAYGAYDIEIVAEVNNAPRLPRDALRREAEYYRASGADVIDIGCTPGRAFPALAEVVRELLASGMRVSIDSFEPAEIRAAVGAGAQLVPICQEIGVRAVLTTEVIPWARGAVREVDIARRLMHHAVTRKTLPKGIDDRLVTLKDPQILAYTETELRELQRAVTDPNFRIFTDRDAITVFNNERFVRGTDLHEIFAQLGVDEPTHAFYLGRELMKAKLAVTLGKTYRQEGALQWGYLSPPDDRGPEHVRLTQRSARSRGGEGGRR